MNHEELKSQLMGAAMQPFIKSLFDRLHVDRGGTLYNSFEKMVQQAVAMYNAKNIPIKDILETTGISRATLYAYVKERNG